MKIIKIFQVAIMLVVLTDEFAFASQPCGGYGQEPCLYLPAKPGQTPPCATKGSTFCETVDGYPEHLIKTLLKNYALKDILTDETKIDFGARKESFTRKYNIPPYGYDQRNTRFPSSGPFDYQGSFYDSPSSNHHDSNNLKYHQKYDYRGGYKEGYHYPKPDHSSSTFFQIKPSVSYSFSQPSYYQRTPRHIPSLINETHPEATQLTFNRFLNVVQSFSRSKRQISSREQLCEVRSNYINPKAALNVRTGNWMYIVNGLETATQLVRTEICLSDRCSNLCQLPNGYNSRCEQKFVQKRLVTLDPQGQKLFTDTFWFPSCCLCTLSNLLE